ncbi:MAG TPA: ATP-binding protein [Solirubrobacteraceae bacterium]
MSHNNRFSVITPEPEKNPYRPGVGIRPLYLAGRDAPIGRFRAMLRAAPEQQANMRVTGLHGVGKTVLLDVFLEQAREDGWEPAFLELQPSHNTDAAVHDALVGLLERARSGVSRLERLRTATGRALRSAELALTWEDLSLSISPGSKREEDLARDVFETVELAISKGRKGLVLLLDEAQLVRDERSRHGEHPLSLLVAPMVALQRQGLPLGVVVCGLPTLAANLQKARSYSERLFRGEVVDSLPHDEAIAALTLPLEATTRTTDLRVAEALVDEVEGYPYFIQLWGSELWDAADLGGVERFTPDLLAAARPDIYERLDRDFYDPRVATLTPAEQDILFASARCPYPPLRSADLNQASDKTPGNVNVLLGRLVEAGVLYRIRKGEYAYTAPKFREYLQRRDR